MKLPVVATFVERATQRKIKGQIQPTTLSDVQLQSQWPYAADAPDQNWNWLEVWLLCRANSQRFECYSAVVDEELHGLMALDLRGRKTSAGHGLVVDYLATNPEDRIERAGLKYIGVGFMAVAVARISARCEDIAILSKHWNDEIAAQVFRRLRHFYI